MKLSIRLFLILAITLSAFTGFSQVYKTAEDTVKLNKEFTEVSNDIANLTAKLEVTQNNMPGVKSKAMTAETNAQEAAVTSSQQADKATSGGVKEARRAKRNSKKAYREAKDAYRLLACHQHDGRHFYSCLFIPQTLHRICHRGLDRLETHCDQRND